MKSFHTASILVILFLFLSVSVLAGTAKTVKEKDAPKELKNQTHCPVMGGKIDSTIYTDIQGHRVYHCCPMCSKSLKKDPDKYFQKAADEGVLFENIQTACPVSGMKLEKKGSYVDYKGHRVYLCCNDCADAFNKTPEDYLAKLDLQGVDMKEMKGMKGMTHMKGKTTKETEKVKKDDHSGHNH